MDRERTRGTTLLLPTPPRVLAAVLHDPEGCRPIYATGRSRSRRRSASSHRPTADAPIFAELADAGRVADHRERTTIVVADDGVGDHGGLMNARRAARSRASNVSKPITIYASANYLPLTGPRLWRAPPPRRAADLTSSASDRRSPLACKASRYRRRVTPVVGRRPSPPAGTSMIVVTCEGFDRQQPA